MKVLPYQESGLYARFLFGLEVFGAGNRQEEVAVTPEEFVQAVKTLASPVCVDEGIELIHVEWQREAGGWVLRLYLDRPGGITLDDCANISRQVSALIDVNLDIDARYSLEVSSPGPQRPLGQPADFNRFKGHQARIRTVEPIKGRRTFTGTVNGAEGDTVSLVINDQAVLFGFSNIKKAHLINYNGDS